MKELIN